MLRPGFPVTFSNKMFNASKLEAKRDYVRRKHAVETSGVAPIKPSVCAWPAVKLPRYILCRSSGNTTGKKIPWGGPEYGAIYIYYSLWVKDVNIVILLTVQILLLMVSS